MRWGFRRLGRASSLRRLSWRLLHPALESSRQHFGNRPMSVTFRFTIMIWGFFAVGLIVAGEAERTTRPPLQPSDTSSPRGMLRSFVEACIELYELTKAEPSTEDIASKMLAPMQRIQDCLDLTELPVDLRESVGVKSAVYLKEVLDRIPLPPEEEIPGREAVERAEQDEPLARWRIPDTRLMIVRVAEGQHEGEYRFSAETVREAATFYSAVKALPYRTEGPEVSPGLLDRYTAMTKRQPKLSADTSSPRGTMTLFITTVNEIYEMIIAGRHIKAGDQTFVPKVMRIYSCLDLSAVPEYYRQDYAAEAAVCLKEILDRVELPPAEQIPGPEELGATDNGEPLARWQVPNTQITIVRMTEGPQKGEYLFSSETVNRAPEIYEKVRDLPYRSEGRPVSKGLYQWWLDSPHNPTVAAWIDSLPFWVRHRVYGMAVWQWAGMILITPLALITMLLCYRAGRARGSLMRRHSLLRYWVTLLFALLAMCVPLLFKHVVMEYLSVRGKALYAINFAANMAFLLAVIIVVLAATSRLADAVVAMSRTRLRGVDVYLIRILCRGLGLVAAAIIFLEGGRYLGLPITTLLASAGIGGLAIALSAQGMIKGLFGTVTVLLDKPYRVGERIIVNGQDGIVEEIGLRSTKLREFLTNNLISIPNDQMAEAEIQNIGKRKHISRITDLHIPLDTPREKIQKAVAAVRAVLENQEGMDPEYPPRVYFNEFNPDSFNIRIMYWFTPPELWKFLEFSEKVNFEI
ncbi:MAG TPA: mechanosensitive ion channel, partial [Planctomycetaceae bacterium]|nr:mechanosensitive ion channel [Planctomycetaceae bacterium]